MFNMVLISVFTCVIPLIQRWCLIGEGTFSEQDKSNVHAHMLELDFNAELSNNWSPRV